MTTPSRQDVLVEHNLGLDTFAYDVAKRLLTCMEAQLALTLAGQVARAAVYPGEEIAPMDVTCITDTGHGQAATRVYRIFPVTSRFPQQDFSPRFQQCGRAQFGITIEMTVYRCAAQMDDNGNPPTVEEIEWNSRVQMDDAAAMRRAVECCWAPRAAGEVPGEALPYTTTGEYVLDDYNPVGPAGDGFGGRMRVQFPVLEVPCGFPPNVVDRSREGL